MAGVSDDREFFVRLAEATCSQVGHERIRVGEYGFQAEDPSAAFNLAVAEDLIWVSEALEDARIYRRFRVSEDGRIFVIDAIQSEVKVFSDGELLTEWGDFGTEEGVFQFSGLSPFFPVDAGLESLAGIALDSQGRIYVADVFNNRVQVFAP